MALSLFASVCTPWAFTASAGLLSLAAVADTASLFFLLLFSLLKAKASAFSVARSPLSLYLWRRLLRRLVSPPYASASPSSSRLRLLLLLRLLHLRGRIIFPFPFSYFSTTSDRASTAEAFSSFSFLFSSFRGWSVCGFG